MGKGHASVVRGPKPKGFHSKSGNVKTLATDNVAKTSGYSLRGGSRGK